MLRLSDFAGFVLSHLQVMSVADHVQGESPPEGEPAGELSRSTNPGEQDGTAPEVSCTRACTIGNEVGVRSCCRQQGNY